MEQNTWLSVTLWVASGAFIGGVVTPVVARGKRISDWLCMALGVGLGAIGNVVLLVPVWAFVATRKSDPDARSSWQHDAISMGELRRMSAQAASRQRAHGPVLEALKANFWPHTRVEAHSHRMAYVWVFAALAVITVIEVTLTYINVPFSITGPLVALSTTKVLLVALFFMHLRYDSRWYSALFASAVPLAALIIAVVALSE
ncbi:MAG TPA: cytochrome C oxidase subunit IV family protein [Aggregatilineaceae bacterium]|nr:cytochrome C oxidase subunit IV family protein [Aggregatilineaceae bacterium]